MRRALVPVICGPLLLVASCALGGPGDDGGRLPPAPLGVTAVAGSATSVHVMWNSVSGGGADVAGYEVFCGTRKMAEVSAGEHMVDVVRLTPSTAYVFTVRARGTDGALGPPGPEVRATTPADVASDTRAPTRPGRPSGKVLGSRAVQLVWGRSTDDRGVASYDIWQGGTKIHSVGGAQTGTVVTGLRPGVRYSFTVRARDAAGNVSPASDPVPLTTAPGAQEGAGTAPARFRVGTHRTVGAYYLDLSWVPPTVDGVITEYGIELDGRPATSLVWGGTAPRATADYSFYVGRQAGVSYRVRIRAKLPDGTWGGYSPEVTVTTGP
ncbi:fibronectin type III domain-containing protein [Streptomyces sp. NPDC096198]|uniref:fibronectin type III domain-containing protein n=1 Tax=Streptomyces sp. NPDC096198 TaxID=3366080 RepID=UPI003815BAA0